MKNSYTMRCKCIKTPEGIKICDYNYCYLYLILYNPIMLIVYFENDHSINSELLTYLDYISYTDAYDAAEEFFNEIATQKQLTNRTHDISYLGPSF